MMGVSGDIPAFQINRSVQVFYQCLVLEFMPERSAGDVATKVAALEKLHMACRMTTAFVVRIYD